MEIKNSFEVPLPPSDAWRVLMDIPRIAPCMPGAELLEQIDDKTYKGKVSVRLGPVALSFVGTAQFVEVDEADRRACVKAQGADAKGRGGANAAVNFELVRAGDLTRVEVTTDVNLTGSVAQYGRASGIIQSVAAELVKQFANNLKQSLVTEAARARRQDDTEALPSAGSVAPATAPAPISGFSLVAKAVWNAISRLFGMS